MSPRPKRNLTSIGLWLPPAMLTRAERVADAINKERAETGEQLATKADTLRDAIHLGLSLLERRYGLTASE